LAEKYSKDNVKFIAINSNSAQVVPEDDFNGMITRMGEKEFSWIYLRDEDQSVALNYGAQKTPHFFVFDKQRDLVYHGAAIDNPKEPDSSSKFYLNEVLHQLTNGRQPLQKTYQPIGCSIKWTAGNSVQAQNCNVIL
jgi:hypothetical protein